MKPRQVFVTALVALLCWAIPAPVQTIASQSKKNAQPLFDQALREYREGRSSLAMTSLTESLKADPDFAPAHELMGLILSAQGSEDEALSHLRRALEIWPDHPAYWANLGVSYLRKGRVFEAEKALSQSLDCAPNSTAYALLGIIRLDQQRSNDAIDLLKKSVILTPEDVQSWYYLGLAYQAAAKNDEAISSYEKVLRLDARDFDAHRQLGILLLDRGLWNKAQEHLQEARDARPQDGELYRYLSEACLYGGDLNRALESGKRAVQLNPEDPRGHYQLGLVLSRLQKTKDSQEEFHLSEVLPQTPEVGPLQRWRQLRAPTTPDR